MPASTNFFDKDQLDQLIELLNIPSPTGYCQQAIQWVEERLRQLELKPSQTPKGGLIVKIEGSQPGPERAVTAHVDTLGAMVKVIKSNGRLQLKAIGGLNWASVEGEGCTVIGQDGQRWRGSLLIDTASAHVHGDEARKRARQADNMEVRLDVRTNSAEETSDLGLSVGDVIAFDPRVETSEAGFIRSRFLDDKAGVLCVLAALQQMHQRGQQPAHTSWIHFSNYEEVGHGAAADLPAAIEELVAVDMAAVGQGQNSTEFEVTICLMDSGGPYHQGLSQRLRSLAKTSNIPHQVDIYPSYRSDGSAHWFAGGSARVALIGPGVDASHHYERTHRQALEATSQLVYTYLMTT